MSRNSVRFSGDSVEKISAIMKSHLKIVNTTSDLRQLPSNLQCAMSMSTPLNTETVDVIPNAPKKHRGVDNSHLLSVQDLRAIFSPSARAKRSSLQKATKAIQKPTAVVEQEIVVVEEEEENIDSVTEVTEVAKPKAKIPFFYLGKCSNESFY